MLKMVTLIARGLIGDTHSRRWAMFILLLGAMLMLFAGATFLAGDIAASAWRFIVYWGICAWLTFASLLLALFDLLIVRAAGRRERRRLEREIIGRKSPTDGSGHDDSHEP